MKLPALAIAAAFAAGIALGLCAPLAHLATFLADLLAELTPVSILAKTRSQPIWGRADFRSSTSSL